MALLDIDIHEVELTFAPKGVLFGSADETVLPQPGEAENAVESTQKTKEVGPNLLGVFLFGLGIAVAIWLGRRRRSGSHHES